MYNCPKISLQKKILITYYFIWIITKKWFVYKLCYNKNSKFNKILQTRLFIYLEVIYNFQVEFCENVIVK